MPAIEAAKDCWPGLPDFAGAVVGGAPMEALLRMSCRTFEAEAAAALFAAAAFAGAGCVLIPPPVPVPCPVPAPCPVAVPVGAADSTGRAGLGGTAWFDGLTWAALGGSIDPLEPMRDRGIARFTSTLFK